MIPLRVSPRVVAYSSTRCLSVYAHAAEREFVLPMPNGGHVLAQERFFVVPVTSSKLIDVEAYRPEVIPWGRGIPRDW